MKKRNLEQQHGGRLQFSLRINLRFRWAARTQRLSKMGTDVHKITETNLCPGKGPWHASFRQRDALVFYRMVTALEDNVNEDDGNYKSNEAPRPSLNTWDGSDSSTRHLLHPQADRNVEEGFREDDRAAKQASIFRDSIQRHIRRPRLIHPSPPPSTGGLQRGRGTPGRRRRRLLAKTSRGPPRGDRREEDDSVLTLSGR